MSGGLMKILLLSPWFYVTVGLLVVFFVYRWWSDEYSKKVIKRLEKLLAEQSSVRQLPLSPSAQPNPDPPLLAQTKQRIVVELAALGPNERFPALINQLADARNQLRWEACYRVIVQSQIVFLQLLARGPIARAGAETIYAEIVANTPSLQGVAFNDWIRYLVNNELALVTVDGFALTVGGQEFLVWKLRNLIPEKS